MTDNGVVSRDVAFRSDRVRRRPLAAISHQPERAGNAKNMIDLDLIA
jgi:hypothetical protein